jgi:hypothetical protein
VTTAFTNRLTRGFAAIEESNVAVCLIPATEPFEPIEPAFRRRISQRENRVAHPSKRREGQKVIVLQLPVTAK